MSEPTKPGYYWAKQANFEDWEVVEVDEIIGTLGVWVVGGPGVRPLSDFTFGPEVTKPEGME